MKQQRKRMDIAPTRLLSRSKLSSGLDLPLDGGSAVSTSIVQRLEREAVPLERQQEYKANMKSYVENKDKLLQGMKKSLADDPEEIREALLAERQVEEICDLFQSFSTLILEQSHSVNDLYENSSYTVDTLRVAEEQLTKTLERSRGSQWTIVIFAVSLAVLLLALDIAHP